MTPMKITPSDHEPLSYRINSIYVGEAGDVAYLPYMTCWVRVLENLPAGWHKLPQSTSHILETGTTARGLIGQV
jgi:hypothetical protein